MYLQVILIRSKQEHFDSVGLVGNESKQNLNGKNTKRERMVVIGHCNRAKTFSGSTGSTPAGLSGRRRWMEDGGG